MTNDAQSLYASPMAPSALKILGRSNPFNVGKVLWLCDEIG